jgi:photosystem II stability/assembly factor-like uncharacterized protein
MAKLKWQRIDGPNSIFSISQAGQVGWFVGTEQGVWSYGAGACAILSEALRPAAITAAVTPPTYPQLPYIFVGAADGIARSADRGETWVSPNMPQRSHVSQIALSPAFPEDGAAFAATLEDGVLVTTDHGQNWHSWNFGLLDLEVLILAVSPNFSVDETVLAGTASGLFRSTNGGRAWRELAVPESAMPLSGLGFVQGTLVSASESDGLSYSKDGGDTWQKRAAFRSGQINALGVSADGTTLAIATPTVVAVSADAGATWQRAEGKTPPGIVSVAPLANGAVLAGTQQDGLWRYGD